MKITKVSGVVTYKLEPVSQEESDKFWLGFYKDQNIMGMDEWLYTDKSLDPYRQKIIIIDNTLYVDISDKPEAIAALTKSIDEFMVNAI
jgi:hypothetical protein